MKFRQILVAAALLAASGTASAVPTTWNYSGTGTCTYGCTGSVTITGSLTGDSAAFLLDGILSALDGISYSWQMSGAITESYSGFASLGAYNVNAAGQITGGSMTFGDLGALEALDIGTGAWSFEDRKLGFLSLPLVRSASGSGAYSVPEPATLGLLGLGLAGLGLMRRRRAS